MLVCRPVRRSSAGNYVQGRCLVNGGLEDLGSEIAAGAEWLKPGWTRVSLNYTLTETEVDYIARAVLDIAEHGWKLLPQYAMDPVSGVLLQQSCHAT
jgi:hypothetical protein